MKTLLFFSLLFVFSCSRCKTPYIEMPESFIEEKEAVVLDEDDFFTFWEEFNDPLLSYLVEETLYSNRNLKIAAEKVLETRARYLETLAPLLPEVDATILATRERNSLTLSDSPFLGGTFFNSYQAGLLMNWEIDFFGKQRDYANAAFFDIASFSASEYALRLLLISEVATFYIANRALMEQIEITKKHIENDTKLVMITEERNKVGIDPANDFYKARALLEQRKSDLYALEGALKENINDIAPLIGQIPDDTYPLLCSSGTIPEAAGKIPCLLPCELLCRRPDIRVAEYNLRAASVRVIASRKELFPTLNLSGFFTYTTSSFTNLFKSASRFWNITPSLTTPIFHGGAIFANIEEMTSIQRQTAYAYEQSVLEALSDVNIAFALYFSEQKRLEELEKVVADQQKALDLSLIRYKGGVVNFLEIIVYERDLYLAQINLIERRKNLMIALVNVYKSLGGGWDCSSLP